MMFVKMANTFRQTPEESLCDRPENGNKSQYARDREVLRRQNDELGMHYLGICFVSSGVQSHSPNTHCNSPNRKMSIYDIYCIYFI